MAGYRKLGRTSSQRKALLRIQATNLLYHGKIVTTEARAKEVRKIVESLIALAVKEKDNFETVKVTAKVARKDADGKRVKEVVDGKKVTVYDEVEKEIKKDMPSRLHARRQKQLVRRKTQRKLILQTSCSTRSLRSTLPVTVVTQESSRSVSVRATVLWQF